jgi:hypothetical protein
MAAACGSNTPNTANSPSSDGGDNTTANSGNAATDNGGSNSEFATINYLVVGDVPIDKTMTEGLPAINKILKEKVNAELTVRWVSWTDFVSTINLALAAQNGDLDLVCTATDWLDAWSNIQKGAFYAMSDDFIEANAPQTWVQVPADHWEECKYEGNIYMFPEDNYSQWVNHGWAYRGDWAREAGLGNGVQSWGDLTIYMQHIKDTKPGVIPWSVGGGADNENNVINGWITSYSPHIAIDGLGVNLFYGKSAQDPYKVSKYFLEDEGLVEFARNQMDWDERGFWVKDVLNNTTAQQEQDMRGGMNGVIRQHTNGFRGEAFRVEEEQPGSDLQFYWFGQENNNLVSMSVTHGAMAIAAKSNHPDRAAQVYDLLRNDEELYRIMNNGFEGEQFILRDDGRTWDRPSGFNEDTDRIEFNWWWGRNDDLDLISGREATEKYNALKDVYNKVAVPFPYGRVVFDHEPISSELNNLANVWATYVPRLVFGKFTDPEAFVEEFRQQLKNAGYEKALEEVERQLIAVYG